MQESAIKALQLADILGEKEQVLKAYRTLAENLQNEGKFGNAKILYDLMEPPKPAELVKVMAQEAPREFGYRMIRNKQKILSNSEYYEKPDYNKEVEKPIRELKAAAAA